MTMIRPRSDVVYGIYRWLPSGVNLQKRFCRHFECLCYVFVFKKTRGYGQVSSEFVVKYLAQLKRKSY